MAWGGCEVWRDLVTANGAVLPEYRISDLGRVMTLKRKIAGGPRVLSSHRTKGYRFVAFRDGGEKTQTLVHRLVAFAFPERVSGERRDGFDLNHLNSNRTDNRPENLEWCAKKKNEVHKRERGLGAGKYLPDSKIYPALFEDYYAGTESVKSLVKRYGFGSQPAFTKIARGQRRPELLVRFLRERKISKRAYLERQGELK